MGELILDKARELFFSYGLKSVSMDDLAKLAGISKKTIYQSYADKNELVEKVAEELIDCHHTLLAACRATAKDAVDEVLKQVASPFSTWASVNPGFFYELERFFPQVWKKLEYHTKHILLPGIINNLERGMQENCYRADLDITFLADLRIHQLKSALQPNTVTTGKMNVSRLVNELTVFYLHGITTEKGKNLLYKYLRTTNENHTNKQNNERH